jgi:hypothetical protein
VAALSVCGIRSLRDSIRPLDRPHAGPERLPGRPTYPGRLRGDSK